MEQIITVVSVLIAALSAFYSYWQVKYAKEEVRLSKEQLEKNSELYGSKDEYFNNVQEVINKINKIIEQEYKVDNKISILNLGLDLETVMPWLDKLIEDPNLKDTQKNYKGLIINPEYDKIIPLINGSSNISKAYVIASLESAQRLSSYQVKKLYVEIKQYSSLPHFHGFVINQRHLFISFTEVVNNKIIGGKFPYLYIQKDQTSKLNKHLFEMFTSWFYYTWKISPQKIKIHKK